MEIKNVAILGGNGTIGSLMGGLIAGFGNATVYLISREKNKLDDSLLNKIYSSIKTDSIKERIVLCDYNYAKKILNKCDWIFESVAESYEIKESIYEIINEYANNNAIITTGTSGLSINRLSNVLSTEKKKNFFGTHFFNPPYHMTLCEIIPTKFTDLELMSEFRKYLDFKLLRTTILSKDKPAFIANRIGFKFMNELILLADQYKEKGGINYIDNLFTGYTGRSMPPLETVDFVGLDIHKAIVDNIYNRIDDEFKNDFLLPNWFEELVNKNCLGDKTNKGLFSKKEDLVYDIKSNSYIIKNRNKPEEIVQIENLISIGEYSKAYKQLFELKTTETQIVAKALIEYIVYAIYVGKYTVDKIEECDDAMATGFNWCPPLALKDLIEEIADFKELCLKYIGDNILKNYDLYKIIEELPKSKYDYKKYIKAI